MVKRASIKGKGKALLFEEVSKSIKEEKIGVKKDIKAKKEIKEKKKWGRGKWRLKH